MDYECTNCNGAGYFDLPDDKEIVCSVCHGTGGIDQAEIDEMRQQIKLLLAESRRALKASAPGAPVTICDRCGDEIPVAEANYVGSELPTWEGATLCNECYAAESEIA